MERIISYEELPMSHGETIYLRDETDPKLYISFLTKGYNVISNIKDATPETIYITGRRQDYTCFNSEEYKNLVHKKVESLLAIEMIRKPKTVKFSYKDLIDHNYQMPFVLKNENLNGGREKFLIATEEDYENLLRACVSLMNKSLLALTNENNSNYVNYYRYLQENFVVQEYVHTPSKYNTTVRLLTSPSKNLLYGSLKYNEPVVSRENPTLLEYLLTEVFPLSIPSIVSNTLSGGKNLLLRESQYTDYEKGLLSSHNIPSSEFEHIIEASERVHTECNSELGIICGFDYIYDEEKNKWFLLEYHSRPMVGDYSKRQGISYSDKDEKLIADGRVRATALNLMLKKK